MNAEVGVPLGPLFRAVPERMPDYAFYSGNCFDGEVLLAMMEAQDLAARYEGLPWGKTDGKSAPACDDANFACASTVRPDGGEVIALFNYNRDKPISVKVGDRTLPVAPYDVVFVER